MKKLTAIVAAILLLVGIFPFAACSPDEETEEPVTGVYSAYPVLDAGFETEYETSPVGTEPDRGWDYSLENGMLPDDFTRTSEFKTEGEYSVKLEPVIGGYISLYQVIPLEGEDYAAKFEDQLADQKALAEGGEGYALPKRGDIVEATADIYVGGTEQTDYMGVRMMVEQENAKKSKSVIAQYDGVALEYGKWNTVSVQAVAEESVIRDDSVLIIVSFKMDVGEGAVICVDNVQVGTRSSSTGGGGETVEGYASRGDYVDIPDAGFEEGNELFKIAGVNAQTTDSDSYTGGSSMVLPAAAEAQYTVSSEGTEVAPETVSAGIWVKIPDTAEGSVKLTLRSRNADSVYADVASAETQVKGRWVYLKTPEPGDAGADVTERLRVCIVNNTDAEVLCDFVQVGDWQRINGNPIKMAFMAYQPWFRNNGVEWGNWEYDSSAGAAYGGRLYDPSVIVDGRRDVASVYDPLIGAYDSTDPEVLNYHADLIKAMGCDVIQVNYYADLASARYQLEVLEKLFDICAEKDMKVSILYEPKIHLNGWIPHATREESIDAMGKDLVKFIETYDRHVALLRYNDAPMIEFFGLNLITGTELGTIKAYVKEQTGYDIPVMGDGVGSGDYSNVMSMFQWTLYNGELAECDAQEALAYCRSINARAVEWAQADVGNRVPVGIVYSGFDDTPVMSWDPARGVIRKIGNTGTEFYTQSWAAVAAYGDELDWVLMATFNDWTEGTILEPTVQNGHALADLTQSGISQFKGVSFTASLQAITENYLATREHDYNDTNYHYAG